MNLKKTFKTYDLLVIWGIGLDYFDACWTAHYLRDPSLELNPFIRIFIPDHIGLFLIYKLFVVPALLVFLNLKALEHKWAATGLALMALFYWIVAMVETSLT